MAADVTPFFSIVIPVHNKAPHLERCLDSVFAQTKVAFEVLAIDDASSDASPAILAAQTDPRLRLFRRDQPGPGGYAARNLGLGEAVGPWIAFLDADDAWAADHLIGLKAAIEGAAAHSASARMVTAAFAGYRTVRADGQTRQDHFSLDQGAGQGLRLDLDAFLDAWLAQGNAPLWTSAVAARRDSLLEIGGFPQDRCRRGGDKDTWLRLAMAGDVVYSGHATATYYRDAINMVTRNVAMNHAPCLLPTLEGLRLGAPPARTRLLERLANQEIFGYARQQSLSGRLSWDLVQGFRARRNPLRAALLFAGWLLPGPLVRGLRGLLASSS